MLARGRDRRQARRRGDLAPTARAASSRTGTATTWPSSTIEDDRLDVAGRVEVGPEPRGVVLSPRRQDGLRRGGRDQRGRPGRPRRARRSPAGWRSAASRAGIALSPDGSLLLVGNARSQDVSVVSTRRLERRPDDPDRGGQPPAGGHRARRQVRLRRQHEEPRVRHHRATTSTSAGCSASG